MMLVEYLLGGASSVNFFPLINELEFIHKSTCTVGYRPNVFSTTLSHLIATNCAHFIVPFVPVRDTIKQLVEEFFGFEFELFVEFTGLMSWTRGASIGWHSDDNRSYLKQRDFTAVCYLNNHEDFKGGLFHFRDSEPQTIAPMAGDVVIYTADSLNIHCVDEILEGERITLTLWFTRDRLHDEDPKLISFLRENSFNISRSPLPASSNMYWFSTDLTLGELGFDIRYARVHALGFDIFFKDATTGFSFSKLESEPLQVTRGSELYEEEFVNMLHLLQVIQLYTWKRCEIKASKHVVECKNGILLSQDQVEQIKVINSLLISDYESFERVFGFMKSSCDDKLKHSFGLVDLSAAIVCFEDYICKYKEILLKSLSHWIAEKSIYSI